MLRTIAEVLKDLDGKPIPPMPPSCHCYECKSPLRASITGCRDTKEGPMCDDCYFKMLGKHFAKHPIITPVSEL